MRFQVKSQLSEVQVSSRNVIRARNVQLIKRALTTTFLNPIVLLRTTITLLQYTLIILAGVLPKLKYFLCTVSYAVHSMFLNRPCSCLCIMSWSCGSFGLLEIRKKKTWFILFTLGARRWTVVLFWSFEFSNYPRETRSVVHAESLIICLSIAVV